MRSRPRRIALSTSLSPKQARKLFWVAVFNATLLGYRENYWVFTDEIGKNIFRMNPVNFGYSSEHTAVYT